MVLKIHVNSLPFNRELEIYQHLKTIALDHSGRYNIRTLSDSFKLQGPLGLHDVFVFQPLGFSLSDFQTTQPNEVFSRDLAIEALCQVLPALDYLHKVANVTHTGEAS
jgi:non-specific serine/threonine protein kinase